MVMRSASVALATLALLLSSAASAAPILASDLILKSNSENLQYSWRVPPEVGVEPALFNVMRAKAEAGLAAGRGQADADAAAAKKAGNPVRQYTDLRYWTIAADTRRLLAITGLLYGYTGGAHGNTGYDSAIWDRKTQSVLPVPALFTEEGELYHLLL
jgi:hypothetical protein